MMKILQNLKIAFFSISNNQGSIFQIQPDQDEEVGAWERVIMLIKNYCKIEPSVVYLNEEELFNPKNKHEKIVIFFLLPSYNTSKYNSILKYLLASRLRSILPENKPNYYPIITIGDLDIANISPSGEPTHSLFNDIDPHLKFLDSGIWHRYVNITSPIEKFIEQVSLVLKDLCLYHEIKLYHSPAAQTALEFQLRTYTSPRAPSIAERGHSHGIAINSIKYHCESSMKRRALEIEDFLLDHFNKGKESQFQWRFLMIDKNAGTPLSLLSLKNNEGITSKRDWIYFLLKDLQVSIDLPKSMADNNKNHEGGEGNIIDLSLSMMREKKYDILLVDYLLNPWEYNSNFLKILLEDNKKAVPEYRRGPTEKFWIFPITSYSFAFSDKLLQLGLDSYNELWYLSGGGDPISTPYLFRYNLLRFMQQQVLE